MKNNPKGATPNHSPLTNGTYNVEDLDYKQSAVILTGTGMLLALGDRIISCTPMGVDSLTPG